MFIDELSPIFKQAIQQPVSFFGGLLSGLLRLNLADDPVKTWLNQNISSSSGPQQISID
jgi:hypothetical protein